MYKLTNSNTIIRMADQALIPSDPANTDYAAYLRWRDGGNVAQPADLPGEPTVAQKILALEATVTPRRLREAALGADGGWLANLDAQIAALRAQL